MNLWNEIKIHLKNNKYDLGLGALAGAIAWFLIKKGEGFGFLPYSVISESKGALNYIITSSTTTLVEYKILVVMIAVGMILFDIFNIGNWFMRILRRKA